MAQAHYEALDGKMGGLSWVHAFAGGDRRRLSSSSVFGSIMLETRCTVTSPIEFLLVSWFTLFKSFGSLDGKIGNGIRKARTIRLPVIIVSITLVINYLHSL